MRARELFGRLSCRGSGSRCSRNTQLSSNPSPASHEPAGNATSFTKTTHGVTELAPCSQFEHKIITSQSSPGVHKNDTTTKTVLDTLALGVNGFSRIPHQSLKRVVSAPGVSPRRAMPKLTTKEP